MICAACRNRLELLKGNRAGQYSIRVNKQWRICFEWPRGAVGPSQVEITDLPLMETAMARPPIHPGKILADELEEVGITATELARQIDVPANRMTQIVQGKRSITGDTALRLAHWFKTSPEFWLNLQSAHDLRIAQRDTGEAIRRLPTRDSASQPRT